MYATDFEYDGRLLSSFGFMICEFGGDGSLNTAETGFNITFNKVKRNGGRKNGLANTSFDDCAQTTFCICKNPEECDDVEITNDEYRDLARWLNRHEFLKFRIISEAEGLDRALCYFNASFNIQKIYVADRLYGLELTAETDAPFGHGVQVEKEATLPVNGVLDIADMSDDVGFTRPDITITCGGSGTLTVTNQTHPCVMQIKNCVQGEVITVRGDVQIITTDLSSHKIWNDFNYEFLKIGNTYSSRMNKIKVSMPCTIKIQYEPIIKDIP